MEIIFFGQLADLTGMSKWQTDVMPDTDSMKAILEINFPRLQQAKYMLAVNRRMVQTNTPLSGNDTIALMPPFSGG